MSHLKAFEHDLLTLLSVSPLHWRINHLHHYCTATQQHLKRCQSVEKGKEKEKKRRLLHSSEIKALYRAEKAILLSLLRSSSAASCHSLGAFLSMISIYRTQEVLHRLREVSQHQVPAPSRTKSLNCHKITCCPHDYSHYCLHEQEASVREGCWVHVYQAASKPFNWSDDRWKGIKSGVDYSGWSTKLNSGGGRRKTRRRNDVSSLNDVSEFCSCYSLHATKNKPYSRVGGEKKHFILLRSTLEY